jgi:hypothetical protein
MSSDDTHAIALDAIALWQEGELSALVALYGGLKPLEADAVAARLRQQGQIEMSRRLLASRKDG